MAKKPPVVRDRFPSGDEGSDTFEIKFHLNSYKFPFLYNLRGLHIFVLYKPYETKHFKCKRILFTLKFGHY